MADVTIKQIDEMDHYQGPNALPGIMFRSAGRQLGVSAWGMNVLDLEPGCASYPEHDHTKDGQEEVYVVLRGAATLHAGDERFELKVGEMVRVAPGQKRKFVAGPEGLRLLALGATPGQAYQGRR
ncbi:MAG TPA: cupin domain-containing protein [Myxococcaceae bacterium]|nr:cupin domain-containing protein [Myxococcaceae bacterium]